jgi:hypothetical protein
MYTPSAPQHAAATGTLTVSGINIQPQHGGSIGSGGGGGGLCWSSHSRHRAASVPDLRRIGTSTFSNNSGIGHPANGGGFIIESLATTVATTSLTTNSAGNRGGGIFVGGASLLLNGTTPSITFTSNTATTAGVVCLLPRPSTSTALIPRSAAAYEVNTARHLDQQHRQHPGAH